MEAFTSGFVPRERVLKYGHFVDSSRAAHNKVANETNRFTAGYGLRHSVGLVQAHSLETCVCENGSGSGEKGRAVHVSVAIDAH
jgi:hypothetical protein